MNHDVLIQVASQCHSEGVAGFRLLGGFRRCRSWSKGTFLFDRISIEALIFGSQRRRVMETHSLGVDFRAML